ncbi:hypothetical protein D3C87_1575200 [compost metagenome]
MGQNELARVNDRLFQWHIFLPHIDIAVVDLQAGNVNRRHKCIPEQGVGFKTDHSRYGAEIQRPVGILIR